MPIMLVLQRTEARLVRWRVRLTALIIVLLVALWLFTRLDWHALLERRRVQLVDPMERHADRKP